MTPNPGVRWATALGMLLLVGLAAVAGDLVFLDKNCNTVVLAKVASPNGKRIVEKRTNACAPDSFSIHVRSAASSPDDQGEELLTYMPEFAREDDRRVIRAAWLSNDRLLIGAPPGARLWAKSSNLPGLVVDYASFPFVPGYQELIGKRKGDTIGDEDLKRYRRDRRVETPRPDGARIVRSTVVRYVAMGRAVDRTVSPEVAGVG